MNPPPAATVETQGVVLEAVERRIQLAIAEMAASSAARVERLEDRVQLAIAEAAACAIARAEEGLRSREEAAEARVRLATNQMASYLEERVSGIDRDVQDQRQLMPAFLNAVATVPALAFELSSLRTTQEAVTADIDAVAQKFGQLEGRVSDRAGSLNSSVEARLAVSDQRNEDLVAFLRRFEHLMIEKESGYDTLREASERMARQLTSVSDETGSEQRRLSDAAEEMRAELAVVRGRVEELRSEEQRAATELSRLREALAEGQTDRGNLWKSAEISTRGIGDLWQRLEFVRKEIMYEARYGSAGELARPSKPVRVVSDDKLEAARNSGDIKLNLGSGHRPVPDYLNVDFRDLPGVDIVTDITDLPFEPHSVSKISAFHVLEHFPQEKLRRLLPYWLTLLRPGGQFLAVVPDGEAMLAHQAAGTYSFEDFRMALFGAQEYQGDFHFNMFTPDSLGRTLAEAGFSEITFPAKGRKNDICFEFEVVATAP